jgi:hypothetical protein
MQKSCLLNISTNDPGSLIRQLRQAGFKSIGNSDPILMTDDSLTLSISRSDEPALHLIYYSDDLTFETRRLTNQKIDHHHYFNENALITFQSFEGLKIQIQEMESAPKTMINFLALHSLNEDQILDPSCYPNLQIGIFNELDLPTADLEKSKTFWENIGFECIEYHTGPYPWGVFSDGMMHIGVHQTDDFSHPMITYSAADMRDRVQKLRDESDLHISPFEGAHRSMNKYLMQMNGACRFFLFSF